MASAKKRPGLTMVGDEMFGSSDTKNRAGAGGNALLTLVSSLVPHGAAALVAGPHSMQTVEVLANQCSSVTVLLRSYRDAETVHNANIAAHVKVVCGTLLKFAPEDRFDLILALDGFERLVSVEGPQSTWAHTADLLAKMLAPRGHLILGMTNDFGATRFATLPQATAEVSDDSARWSSFIKPDKTRPSTVGQMTRQLEAADLCVRTVFATFPSTEAASVVVPAEFIDHDSDPLPYLLGAITSAAGDIGNERLTLVNPGAVMRSAINAGYGVELAPGWAIVASKPTVDTPNLPQQAIVFEPDAGHVCGVSYEILRNDDGDWVRRPLEIVTHDAGSDGLTRTSTALEIQLARCGRLLEDVLLAGCALGDTASIRAAVAAYASWLSDLGTDGHLTGWAVFATPENTVVDDEQTFSCMDPSWTTTNSYPVDLVLARGLLKFSTNLLAGRYAHPWPGITSSESIVVILAGMARHDVDPGLVRRAAALDEQIRQAGFETPASRTGAGPSYRELIQLCEAQKERLLHAQAKLEWYEDMLASREHSLRKAQRIVDVLSGNRLYPLARFVVRLLRRGKRWAGQLATRLGIRRFVA